MKAKKIRIGAILNTTPTGSTINKNVAIKSTDMLDIIVTAKIKPSYPLSFGNNNNDKGTKGGLK